MSDIIFNEEDRLIFVTKENGKEVAYDPAVLWRNFRKAQRDLGVNYDELARTYRQVAQSEKEEEELAAREEREPRYDLALADLAVEAITQISELGRRTFGKEPLQSDGSGWTEAQGQMSLLEYLQWQEKLRAKQEASLSGSPSTVGHQPDSASEASPTRPIMGSN